MPGRPFDFEQMAFHWHLVRHLVNDGRIDEFWHGQRRRMSRSPELAGPSTNGHF